MEKYKKILILIILAGTVFTVICSAQQKRLSWSEAVSRAKEIVSRMSLDEKIAQLHGIQDQTHYRVVPGLSRLGIPALTITNGPAGFGPAGPGHQSKATALPAPVSLAATWDTAAARLNGEVAGEESAAFGNLLLESPDVNIARTPHNGRTFEGYGEDPYLAGQMAAGYIQGVQSQGILANVKHFAGNNQEDNRFHVNAVIDERTLHEIYLPAFEAAVKQGHVASVMAAYNKLNGYHCTENDTLLTLILRKEWGFKGFVTSDFGAVHSTVPAALHGLDVELPTGKYWGNGLLKAAVDSGKVPVSVIDNMLVRRYSTMMHDGVWNRPAPSRVTPAGHAAVALHLATEGMVLLKNENKMLPWKERSVHSIALIGPFSGRAMTGGGGSSRVDPILTVNPLEGMQHFLGERVKVFQYDGRDIDSAVALAHAVGRVVLMLGDFQTEGRDHPIALQGNQDELAKAVLAANPRTVVVLKSGGPVFMPWVDQAPAILEAWYPGEEDGNAVPAVLFGKVNPSGKLPITFPERDADLPQRTPEQYPGVNNTERYSEGIFMGYRWYDEEHIKPLFPFGYGLSYTSFVYKNLKIVPESGDRVSVTFTITNTGKRRGAEVAELYVGLPSSPEVPEPPKELKGFERVELAPGRSATAHFLLDREALSYWDIHTHGWKMLSGKFQIYAASSSRDIRLKGTFQEKQ